MAQVGSQMKRRLNVTLVFWALASIAVLLTVVHIVHSQQMQRNAGALLREAKRAIDQEQYARAASLLQRYLTYEPDDTEAVASYADALQKSSSSFQTRFRVFLLLEQVLRSQPERVEARKQVIECAIDLRRFEDAIGHLAAMLAGAKRKAQWEHKLGWCLEALGQYEESARAFRRAIAEDPGQLESFILLAELLDRRLKRPAEAPAVMDAMVEANPDWWKAYLVHARFQFGAGKLDDAVEDVRFAFELAPEQEEVLLAATDLALIAGNPAEARRIASQGLVTFPKNERLHRSLATLEMRAGRWQDAIKCLQNGLAKLPESVPLRVQMAEAQLESGQLDQVLAVREWCEKHAGAKGLVAYLDGRLLMAAKKWSDALAKFQEALDTLGMQSEWSSNLRASMGACHGMLLDKEKQLHAYRDAVVLNPGNAAARLELGKCLLRARLFDEAALEFKQLTRLAEGPTSAWELLAAAKVEVFRQSAPLAGELAELRNVLEKAEEVDRASAAMARLNAWAMVFGGRAAEAEEMLVAATQARPLEVPSWNALAELVARRGDVAGAIGTLAEAEVRTGPRADLMRTEIGLWTNQRKLEAVPAIVKIGERATKLTGLDQAAVLQDVAETLVALGHPAEAEAAWRTLAALLPSDIRCRLMLFDLALGKQRDQEAVAILADLKRIEGDAGAWWKIGEAARGLEKAERGDRSLLEPARARLAEVRRQRPDWSRVALLEGCLHELDGNMQQAMDDYRRAIELGERPATLVVRVARWLHDRQRLVEAYHVIRRLEDVADLPKEQGRFCAEVALENHDLLRGIWLARKVVPGKSRDYRDQIWLARVEWLCGMLAESDATLQHAANTAPRVPDTWVALVQHMVRTDQPLQLEMALQEMRRQVPPDILTLTEARCLEVAGRTIAAEKAFRAALAEDPSDPVTVRQAAEFFLHSDQFGKAEPLLRFLLAKSSLTTPDVMVWAKRELALVLAIRNGPHDIANALELVPRGGPGGTTRPADDRVRAFVLANDPAQVVKAVRLFEQTVQYEPLTPDDRFLLSRMYDLAGEGRKAQKQLQALLAIYPDRPWYLAHAVRRALAHGALDDARTYLGVLDRLEPGSVRSLNLHAALEKALGGR
jgi:cellulose synthase operon protein C